MSFTNKIKDQFSVAGANFVAAILNGIFWLYLASTLDKVEYGEIGFLISIAEIGFSFANFGFAGLITVYGAKGEKVFFPSYELGIISSAILASIIFFITQNLAISLLIIGSMMWTLLQAEFNSKKQYTKWAAFHLIRRILMIVFSVSLIQIFGIEGIVWGFFIATLPAILGIKKFLESERTRIHALKSKLSFMISFYFSGLTMNLFWWGDKTIIGSIFGFSTLGEYQLATQFFGLLQTIPVALRIYLVPQESQNIKNSDIKKFSILAMVSITVVAIIMLPFIITEFFSDYVKVVLAAQIMVIGIIPITLSTIMESKFLGNEKSNYVLISNGIQTGIYFILIIVLGNSLGINGFAIGFVIALSSRTLINYFILKKKF